MTLVYIDEFGIINSYNYVSDEVKEYCKEKLIDEGVLFEEEEEEDNE